MGSIVLAKQPIQNLINPVPYSNEQRAWIEPYKYDLHCEQRTSFDTCYSERFMAEYEL